MPGRKWVCMWCLMWSITYKTIVVWWLVDIWLIWWISKYTCIRLNKLVCILFMWSHTNLIGISYVGILGMPFKMNTQKKRCISLCQGWILESTKGAASLLINHSTAYSKEVKGFTSILKILSAHLDFHRFIFIMEYGLWVTSLVRITSIFHICR